MFVNERHSAILAQLKEAGSVQATDLARRFGASLATVRRDLEALQAQGLVRRVYGGAVPVAPSRPTEQFFDERIDTHGDEKRAIGRAAAAMVGEGETIFLDIGTTVLEVARSLRGIPNLTVLTSSLPVLNELANSDIAVYSLGGLLRPKELALVGYSALATLKGFCVDRAFVGAGGISPTNGITDYDYDSAHLRRAAIQRAKQSVLVADSSKFGADVFAIVCEIEEIDVAITDGGVDPAYVELFGSRGVQLMLAKA